MPITCGVLIMTSLILEAVQSLYGVTQLSVGTNSGTQCQKQKVSKFFYMVIVIEYKWATVCDVMGCAITQHITGGVSWKQCYDQHHLCCAR